MQFLNFPPGHLDSGAVVEVVLRGVESDVYLATTRTCASSNEKT